MFTLEQVKAKIAATSPTTDLPAADTLLDPALTRPAIPVHVEFTPLDVTALTSLSDIAENAAFRFLASVCVSIGGKFRVKLAGSNLWIHCGTKGEAISIIQSDYLGPRTPHHLSTGDIGKFFEQFHYPVLAGTVFIPGGPAFVSYLGQPRLNTWWEEPLAHDPAHIDSPELDKFLLLITRNLFGQAHTYESLQQLLSERPKTSQVYWCLNWLAHLYQRLGTSLNTTLWCFGQQNGVGKGLLFEAMRTILGSSNVKKVSLKELKGEWDDVLASSVLVNIDEIDNEMRREVYDDIKRKVGSPDLQLRRRGVGQIDVPNVLCWYFTGNNPKPIVPDEEDRRNTFIATTENPADLELADEIGVWYKARHSDPDQRWYKAVHGFAALLYSIDLDHVALNRFLHTPMRDDLLDMSRGPLSAYLHDEKSLREWPVGGWQASEELYNHVKHFAETAGFSPVSFQRTVFDQELAKLRKRGILSDVTRAQYLGARVRGQYRLKGGNLSVTLEDAKNQHRAASEHTGPGGTNLLEMRRRMSGHRASTFIEE